MTQALKKIRHVVLDMDGTIYKGNTLFPETLPFLQRLGELGIGHTFLTNNPSKSQADYLAALAKLGVPTMPEQLYTSAHATIRHLQQERPEVHRIFFLGTASMVGEFQAAGFSAASEDPKDEPDAVVVAFDPTLNFERLGRAAWWIRQGKPFIATNPDTVCPTDAPTVLVDCGAICAALHLATGRKPDSVLGKPDPAMLQGILERTALQPQEVAMVGDRLYTDLAMAHRSGALGVLVLTGETTAMEAATAKPAPQVIVAGLYEFGELLAQAQNDALVA